MRQEVLAAVIIVVIVSGMGAEYFAGTRGSSESDTSATSVAYSTTLSAPTVSSTSQSNSTAPAGLELKATISPSTLNVSQLPEVRVELLITISLYNSLPGDLVLTTGSSAAEAAVPNDFGVTGFPVAMWGACLSQEPVEFMVVKGNFSLSQLREASVNASTAGITCEEGGSVSSIEFQPNSSIANTSGVFCVESCSYESFGSYKLSTNFTINGYWAYPLNSSEASDVFTTPQGPICEPGPCLTYAYPEVGPTAQHIFTAGWYTLVVSDAWGQTDVLRFEALA